MSSLDAISVHCRTGSLEKYRQHHQPAAAVHCRTGSLEIGSQVM
ncbi:hypothetical protein VIB_001193 [Vibrio metschnikovii CIP 69.14]|nr:hypothetical protein VIB_001193 [Vibrio metschnikovii CIP 69.14]